MHHRTILLNATAPGRHDAYLILVVIHAVVALIAFGAIALSGFYGSTARNLARPGVIEELQRYFAVPPRAEAAVLAVAVFGVAALAVDPTGGGFAHAWVAAALVLWLVASAVWVGVARPAERSIRSSLVSDAGRPPLDYTQVDPDRVRAVMKAGRRLARASAATDVIFVVALGLMVFQPG